MLQLLPCSWLQLFFKYGIFSGGKSEWSSIQNTDLRGWGHIDHDGAVPGHSQTVSPYQSHWPQTLVTRVYTLHLQTTLLSWPPDNIKNVYIHQRSNTGCSSLDATVFWNIIFLGIWTGTLCIIQDDPKLPETQLFTAPFLLRIRLGLVTWHWLKIHRNEDSMREIWRTLQANAKI